MSNTKEKNILIATFIPKNKVDWYYKYINKKFSVKKECIYLYEVENNELDYLLTFKMINDKRIDFKFHFDNATIVNVKCGCIFSINGLNRLIEELSKCEIGNIDHSKHEIDWNNYRGKLVLSNKSKLSIKKIKKIEVEIDKN